MKMPLERQGTAVKVFKGTCHTFLGFATSKGRALALANKINHSAIREKLFILTQLRLRCG